MGVRCDLFCMRSCEKQNVIGLCVVAFSLAALDLAPLDLSLVGSEWEIGVSCPLCSAHCSLAMPAYRLAPKLYHACHNCSTNKLCDAALVSHGPGMLVPICNSVCCAHSRAF